MTLPHGRTEATITDLRESYALALDDWGTTYFIFHTALQQTGQYGFTDLRLGTRVALTPIDHPKGARGIEVEVVWR